ncbi:AI-2E family transporter [Rubrivirga sp.]|uniref:AI-2E family transporter n=1 Tax=Rubrivirga sp. TaxID=1885344 RepID=UPI003B52AD02
MPDPRPDPVLPRSRLVLLTGGVLALLALLWVLRDALGPFWVAVAGAAVLWPLRRERAAQAVLWAGGLVFGAYLLGRLAGVLAPFVAVFVAAYLLDPAVTAAERRWHVPRWASTLALTLVVVGAVVGGLVLLVPMAVGQVEELTTQAVALALRAPEWVAESDALAQAENAGLVDRDALVAEITTFVPGQIQAALARVPAFLAGLVRQVGALLGLVTTAALVPVLLFFSLKDFPVLRDGLVGLLPRVDGRRAYLERAGSVFGSYVRGQLTISALSAVLVAVPLALFGVPYSLLLGLAAGLLNLIPSLGSVLTYVLGVTLMLAFGTLTDVLIVLAVLAVQAVIEQAVLTPNIMSQQVGLHPVVILLALFVCGALFGLLGLILAVPAAALVAGVVRARREALVIDLGDEAEDDALATDPPPQV